MNPVLPSGTDRSQAGSAPVTAVGFEGTECVLEPALECS